MAILKGGPADGKEIEPIEGWQFAMILWRDFAVVVSGGTTVYMPKVDRVLYYVKIDDDTFEYKYG